jgi:hypothetical protein
MHYFQKLRIVLVLVNREEGKLPTLVNMFWHGNYLVYQTKNEKISLMGKIQWRKITNS